MKNNKKLIVMSTLLMAVVLLGAGTIAYFRRVVNGNVTGNAGNLVVIPPGQESGVRPAVSLSNKVSLISGDGSFERPYVVG